MEGDCSTRADDYKELTKIPLSESKLAYSQDSEPSIMP